MNFRHCCTLGLLVLQASALLTTAQSTSAEPEAGQGVVQLEYLLDDYFKPEGRLEVGYGRTDHVWLDVPGVQLELAEAPSKLAAQVIVRVRAITPEGESTTRAVVLRIKLWREGWGLRESVTSRSPVRIELLDRQLFDAMSERNALEIGDAAELDFSRSLSGGRLLTWRDVVQRPLVRRNQPIEVTASEGGLTVTLRAIALHDAVRGEAVRVRNPESRKEFIATVSDPSRAYVQF
jgi:flagella basal body P-ring formation protein FlgA